VCRFNNLIIERYYHREEKQTVSTMNNTKIYIFIHINIYPENIVNSTHIMT